MRTRALAALAFLLAAVPAVAETPNSCSGTTVTKLSLSSDGTKLSVVGRIQPGDELPDLAGGVTGNVTISLAYEPEADPTNAVFSVTLPQAGFVTIPGGVQYRDRTGAVGGITRVQVRARKDGTRKLLVKRLGTPLGLTARTVRLVFQANGGCTRTCPSTCTLTGSRLRCAKSTDLALCGVKSGCEMLNLTEGEWSGRDCMFPYPSDLFLRTDGTTQTGRRVAYPREAMPANTSGVHIDPASWNVLDGFSPGAVGLAYWPQGVDLTASQVPGQLFLGDSVLPSSNTLLIEADAPGCVRVPHFGENDVSLGVNGVTPVAPPNQAFMIRPGVRLKNGTRYIVALRNLVGQDAQPIAPGTAFRALRDNVPSGSAAVEGRRTHFDQQIFGKLVGDCGVPRGSLTLAWDFTTASDDMLTRWLVHMRDQTFAQLGSGAPAFTVSNVVDDPFPGDPRVCRRVEGTYTVPLWTTFNGTGSVLNLNPVTNLPVQNGVATNIPFWVSIPCSVTNPPTPGRPVYYGHGLLGSGDQVFNSYLRDLGQDYKIVLAGTDWQGFSSADIGTILGFIGDLSNFRKLAERLHQGVLNQLVLGRLLHHPDGFASHPAFQYSGTPIIDTSGDVFFYGCSQGGIEGGVVMALSQEATRGVLCVPGANYSTLLHRSVDFEAYFLLLKGAYPDDLLRNLTLPLIQQLWDRSEPNGWYHHIIPGTVPNTPAHDVLVHMATSDAEVANLATTIMVRSMGIPQVSPVVASYYAIPELVAPLSGSAMVESNGGYGPVPLTNLPPADNPAHGAMRRLPAFLAQIDAFLQPGGTVQNFCAGVCDPE